MTLSSLAIGLAPFAGCQAVPSRNVLATNGANPQIAAWLDDALSTKGQLAGRLDMSRFVEPIYFLLAPTSWIPSQDQLKAGLPNIVVPRGFVTDLASVPPIFFSLLRADGNYAHAAVVHDFLYWDQSLKRSDADEILRDGMRYLEVEPVNVSAIYAAVKTFGESAWNANRKLRDAGESRTLRLFPDKPNTRWEIWRKQDVFG